MIFSDLSDVPHFAEVIANRAWHEWWTDGGMTLAEYHADLVAMTGAEGIPFALVAHDDGRYLGSVLVIDNDLEARPQYMPWIAALWVEPDCRGKGVAASLIAAAREAAARLGHDRCFLCATPENSPYYLNRGFALLETDVDGLNVFVI